MREKEDEKEPEEQNEKERKGGFVLWKEIASVC